MARENKLSLLRPLHPERVCWGCNRYCRADDLACGNGSERTPHPVELFGEDWSDWAEAHGAPDTHERLFGADRAAAASADAAGSRADATPARLRDGRDAQ